MTEEMITQLGSLDPDQMGVNRPHFRDALQA